MRGESTMAAVDLVLATCLKNVFLFARWPVVADNEASQTPVFR